MSSASELMLAQASTVLRSISSVRGWELVGVPDEDPFRCPRDRHQTPLSTCARGLVDDAEIDVEVSNRRMAEEAGAGSGDDTRLVKEGGFEPVRRWRCAATTGLADGGVSAGSWPRRPRRPARRRRSGTSFGVILSDKVRSSPGGTGPPRTARRVDQLRVVRRAPGAVAVSSRGFRAVLRSETAGAFSSAPGPDDWIIQLRDRGASCCRASAARRCWSVESPASAACRPGGASAFLRTGCAQRFICDPAGGGEPLRSRGLGPCWSGGRLPMPPRRTRPGRCRPPRWFARRSGHGRPAWPAGSDRPARR